MRYIQKYREEVDAILWTGDNFSDVVKFIGGTRMVVSLCEARKIVKFGGVTLFKGDFLCKYFEISNNGEALFRSFSKQLFYETYERADDDSGKSKDDLVDLIKDIKAWDVETSMDEGKPDFFALPIDLRQRIQKAIERAE